MDVGHASENTLLTGVRIKRVNFGENMLGQTKLFGCPHYAGVAVFSMVLLYANSPRCSTNLPVFLTGHLISRLKSIFELFST